MNAYPVFLSHVAKISTPIVSHGHRGVTFLRIFLYCFADRENVLLPLRHKILQTITFGLFIPDKTAKIMGASENLKPTTQAKLFSCF